MNHHNTLQSNHYDNGEPTEDRRPEYALGNPELPIAGYRERIVDAVDGSQAVVITAETGAGKSTQVPQFLAESGYEVIVTQPRVVAARSVAERVQDEITATKGGEYADFVGYRTARERGDSQDNQILFVTDGLQAVRELAGQGVGKRQVLVLDEVHEWNENMEVLVAWAKKRMAEDPTFKVVTMSATMEAESLAEFFALDEKNNIIRDAPVIEVPGRTFEVDKKEGGDVTTETIAFAREGKNTLVFVPGKAEIEQVMAEVKRANIPGAAVLPLHGQLDASEQRKIFQNYEGAKVIVATNVAQTSITIDDIDAVVDSGLERRNEVKNGVEGLYLRPISKADCMQRAGRAGRTKEGEYVLARLGNNQFVPLAERESYGTPEIMRTRLDGLVLRLSKNGLDASELEFYHQPEAGEIIAAKQRLQKLGALTDAGGITKIGRQMERMPVESHYARMMIEARQYGEEVQLQLAAMLAVQEVGGITFNGRGSERRWRRFIGNNTTSDMLAQLDVFVAAQSLSGSENREYDIIGKNLGRAREVLRQLRRAENLPDQDIIAPNAEERTQLVNCIIAGMVDHLYIQSYGSEYKNGDTAPRQLSDRSLVAGARMVVGNPFDLQVTTRRGPLTLRLIESATTVPSVEILKEVAPQLFSEKFIRFDFDAEGRIIEQYEVYFNGVATGQRGERMSEAGIERHSWLVEQVYQRSEVIQRVMRELAWLQQRTTEQLPSFNKAEAIDLLAGEVTLETDTLESALAQVSDFDLDYIVPMEKIVEIIRASPQEYANLQLSYQKGVPYVNMKDGDVIAWEGPTDLPDGRPIMLRQHGYYADGHSIAGWKKYLIEKEEMEATRARKIEEAARERQAAEVEAVRAATEEAARIELARVEAEKAGERRLAEEQQAKLAAEQAEIQQLAEAQRLAEEQARFEREEGKKPATEDSIAELAAFFNRR